MKVQVINKSDNDLPNYETIASAGCDVRSTHGAHIGPGLSCLIKTGLYVEIPIGYEIQITVLNTPGTIDADYRGEIGVIIINHGLGPVSLGKGERIAQLVLNKVEQIKWESVLALSDTSRGDGGFGSTGKK